MLAGPTGGTVGLSVVVPVFNEERGLAELLRRVTPVCHEHFAADYEIVLVNDGSKDASWRIICDLADRDHHVVGIDLSRNHGHQLALSAGLEAARGDLVFVLDADLQDPPELLGTMLGKVREGNDVVYGRRIARHGETAFKRSTAAMFYRLLDRLVETDMPHDTGDFRLMTRRVVKQLNSMPERFRYIRGMVSWVGFAQASVDYERDVRFAGSSSYPLRKMMLLAIDAITSFSTRPLRLASLAGLGAGLSGLGILGWVIYTYLTKGTVHGWTSTVGVVLLLGSAQLLILGVFGEYLGRMYMESKGRPLFVVRDVYRQTGTARSPRDADQAKVVNSGIR